MKLEFDVPDLYAEGLRSVINEVLESITQDNKYPKDGEKIYYIDVDGLVKEGVFDKAYDKHQFDIGNIFSTKEKAEFKAEQLKVLHELEELADDDQSWISEDKIVTHYILTYRPKFNRIVADDYATVMNCGIHFKTQKSAQAAIDKIGVDRLKKYYFCVGE